LIIGFGDRSNPKKLIASLAAKAISFDERVLLTEDASEAIKL
jgi:hypothetical protein